MQRGFGLDFVLTATHYNCIPKERFTAQAGVFSLGDQDFFVNMIFFSSEYTDLSKLSLW